MYGMMYPVGQVQNVRLLEENLGMFIYLMLIIHE